MRWVSALALVVAGGAAALGVGAITTDDVSGQPAPIVLDAPAPIPADGADRAGDRRAAVAVACNGQARLEIPCFE